MLFAGVVSGSGCTTPGEAIAGGDGDDASPDATTASATTSENEPTDPATSSSPTDPSDDVDSGDGSDDATDTGPAPPPGCGNMIVEGEEACDDGNDDDTDDCTTLCQPPSCRDGIVSGEETDVDCGGSTCKGCAMGESCAATGDCDTDLVCPSNTSLCQLPPSCLYLLELDPMAPSDDYDLDPNGDGVGEKFTCDMDYDGGGWTVISAEQFGRRADPSWSDTTTTDCGQYDGLLGGYDVTGDGDTLSRTYDLLGVPHTELAVQLDMVFIDSWDGEDFSATIDAMPVISYMPPTSGGNNQCGGGWDDEAISLQNSLPHATNSAAFAATSTLDQPTYDESWGIDAVRILVR